MIERFGGTVEKFIGDAVMAVWGTPSRARTTRSAPSAQRSTSSRSSTRSVTSRLPGLRARAGVLTGEAAVTSAPRDQALVAGDLVNTASRVQDLAEPGTVLVGERTQRATEAAIAYQPAGDHALKGKTEAIPLWRAERVTSVRGGQGAGPGLEAPFVGRERELRLVKDLFHATSEEGRAHLVSVVGLPGMGKSRFGWEFRSTSTASPTRSGGTAAGAFLRRGRLVLGAVGDGADARTDRRGRGAEAA